MLINLNSEDRVGGSNDEPIFDLSQLGIHRTRGGGKLRVLSCELPYTFYICTNNRNNRFRYTDSNLSEYTIYLGSTVENKEGSPNINTLMANLKSQLDVNSDGAVWTITLDSTRAKLKFVSTKNATFTALTSDPETFNVLGFNQSNFNIVMNVAMYSDVVVNLSPYRYIYVRSNLPIKTGHDFESFNKNSSSVIVKVPLNATPFSNIYYEPQNDEVRECASLTSQFQFHLTDRKNRSIDLNGVPWSITLDFDMY